MQQKILVNLGNLLLSLSDALDLADTQLVQHQQRTAYIAFEMGREAGLSELELKRMFIAALLHDIGSFSLEYRIALHRFEVKDIEQHCIAGESLLKKTPWLRDSAKLVRNHHRAWKDWDEPIDKPHVLMSQIVSIADYLERSINRKQYILHQNEELISKITSQSNKMFHPQVVGILVSVARREEFWFDLVSPRLYSLLLHNAPSRNVELELEDISSIAELFANIIDFRSHFTATHTSGVAACAVILTKLFGLTEVETSLMEVAGYLHDLGKLAIPNRILEKPGKLNRKEFAIIRSHTYYTYLVLNTIGGLQRIAEWAAYHHEKLDGSGYPFHRKANELDIGARIMTVADIFTAIAEDRPYRKGMNRREIENIMNGMALSGKIDTRIVSLLFENYDEVLAYVKEKQCIAKDQFEKQSPLIRRKAS